MTKSMLGKWGSAGVIAGGVTRLQSCQAPVRMIAYTGKACLTLGHNFRYQCSTWLACKPQRRGCSAVMRAAWVMHGCEQCRCGALTWGPPTEWGCSALRRQGL